MNNPVVLTQFPTDVSGNFVSTVNTGKQLAEKYSHLVDVDPFDTAMLKQLDEAISDVKRRRTENERERKHYLRPFTDHSARVNAICKEIQSPIAAIESRLKDEKSRVDEFLADQRAAQVKQWRAAVEDVISLGRVKYGSTLDQLSAQRVAVGAVVLEDEGFGELLAEAEAARTTGILTLNNAIQTEQDRASVAKAKAEMDAERKRQADEMAAMRAELDAVRKEQEEAQAKIEAEQAAVISANRVVLERQREVAEKLLAQENAKAEELIAERGQLIADADVERLTHNRKREVVDEASSRHEVKSPPVVPNNPKEATHVIGTDQLRDAGEMVAAIVDTLSGPYENIGLGIAGKHVCTLLITAQGIIDAEVMK